MLEWDGTGTLEEKIQKENQGYSLYKCEKVPRLIAESAQTSSNRLSVSGNSVSGNSVSENSVSGNSSSDSDKEHQKESQSGEETGSTEEQDVYKRQHKGFVQLQK